MAAASTQVVEAGEQVTREDHERPHVDVGVVAADHHLRPRVGGGKAGIDEAEPMRWLLKRPAAVVEDGAQHVARRLPIGDGLQMVSPSKVTMAR